MCVCVLIFCKSSLRHTLSVLEQHADALHEKIQASVQKTHQQKYVVLVVAIIFMFKIITVEQCIHKN